MILIKLNQMNNISNKYIMTQEKNDLTQSTFEFIKYDNKNIDKYDLDYLILLNKKFSYPMFLTSSNKEEVKFTYDLYYVIDTDRYDFIDEIDELISEDFNYSYSDVITIIDLKFKEEKINFEFDEMLDLVFVNNKEILEMISDKLPIHLWGYKYYTENGKMYRENYL